MTDKHVGDVSQMAEQLMYVADNMGWSREEFAQTIMAMSCGYLNSIGKESIILSFPDGTWEIRKVKEG